MKVGAGGTSEFSTKLTKISNDIYVMTEYNSNIKITCQLKNTTRPKPVGHGYVFTQKIRSGPDMGCLCLQIIKG